MKDKNILNKFKLDGKRALVTGCRRGIGLGMAQALSQAGAEIVGVSRTLEEGSEVEKVVKSENRDFKGYACDFSDRKSLYDFIKKVKADFEKIDILVNNAGTIKRKPAAEYPDNYWDEVIEVNLNAQFVLAREFGKDMIKRGNGKIIFTASLLTFFGGITVPAYAASKGGVGQLIKALSNEWSKHGVNVNGIAPGYIATDNTKALREDKLRNQGITNRIPVGRWGTPEDLKGAVVYLASSASDYVCGTILTVDGGWTGR